MTVVEKKVDKLEKVLAEFVTSVGKCPETDRKRTARF